MKRNVLIAVLLLLFCVVSVGAQDLLLEYVDGIIEVREGTQWYELFIGETIEVGEVLRLADDSYAELSSDGLTIKLSESGTYDTEEMVGRARRQTDANIGSFLTSRLANIGAATRSRGTVGGVRGSEAVTRPNTMWVGGESVNDLISEGIDRLAEDEFQEAYWIFEEAYDYSDEVTEHRASFYLGYAAALIGETDESLRILSGMEPEPSETYYTDHIVILAQLYVETFAYQRALDLLGEFRATAVPDSETEQLVRFLEGASLQGLDRRREAATALREAIELDPASGVAAAARTMLE